MPPHARVLIVLLLASTLQPQQCSWVTSLAGRLGCLGCFGVGGSAEDSRSSTKEDLLPRLLTLRKNIMQKGWEDFDPAGQNRSSLSHAERMQRAVRAAEGEVNLAEEIIKGQRQAPNWIREGCERHASDFWDAFYMCRTNRFFKDRNVLRGIFPEVMPESIRNNPLPGVPVLPCSKITKGHLFNTTLMALRNETAFEASAQAPGIDIAVEMQDPGRRAECASDCIAKVCAWMNQTGRTLPEAFVIFDRDGDGVLSREDLRSSLLGLGVAEHASVGMHSLLDRDKSGKVTMSAWTCVMLQRSTSLELPRMLGLGICNGLPCPDVLKGKDVLLEVGCGVGNSVFPLLRANPKLFVFCCDFSHTAIAMLRANPEYDPERVFAWVCDVTEEEGRCAGERTSLERVVPEGSVSFVTLVWVLSALTQRQAPALLRRLHKLLRPDGIVLLRDYAKGDLTHMRHAQGSRLEDDSYIRGDLTIASYYSIESLAGLFQQCGYIALRNEYEQVNLVNRKQGVPMVRLWLNAKFGVK